ncbi:MAG: metal ABC transporter ATP-binding protein [Aigarchaeota archaeon]|nr:metal ABC transporter ATP-binding protein [Aigarchaeota archaeon]MDW8093280.1 metal ABC transporter ATP-binding protein [Nitrososphaerota archaeon]
MNNAPIVEVEDLAASYDGTTYVLYGLSFVIRRNEVVYVLGPNGGGKSTLFKVLIGSLPPVRGTVRLFGKPLKTFKDWRRIGYLPQVVRESIPEIPASVGELLASSSSSASDLSPEEALELMGFDDVDGVMKRRLTDLSGGQLQRVMIGLALINKPELLLLDEPTVHMDTPGMMSLMDVMRRLSLEMDTTIMLATHEISVIPTSTTRVLCINRYHYYDGTIGELVNSETLCKIYGFHTKLIDHGHG